MIWQILQGDCIELMAQLAENSVDAVVTDPPYHLKNNGGGPSRKCSDNPYSRARAGASSRGFMGKRWDGGDIAFDPATWAAVLRVLKPGGFLLAFGGTRTYHRMACAVEDAGFEIRDQIGWLFGSGFPKSKNGDWGGTALKPGWEPVVLARKALDGTVEHSWRKHGTGALNIDGCRIAAEKSVGWGGGGSKLFEGGLDREGGCARPVEIGRWPANVIHDGSDEVLAAFPDAPGQQAQVTGDEPTANGFSGPVAYSGFLGRKASAAPRADGGSAARFFYCAKASRADRNAGLENPGPQLPTNCTLRQVETAELRGNIHPTVKPTALMRYLVRLVTPAGGLVLDPFAGSGSTGRGAVLEGMRFIGMDSDEEFGYVDIARARIAAAEQERAEELAAQRAAAAQTDLFAAAGASA
jgi:site-specific DNA-methyltransferase (adenine-specific)